MAPNRPSKPKSGSVSRPILAALTALLPSGLAEAQVRPGQVVGVVRDEMRNGIPGVTVVLDSAHLLQRARTDSLGRFAIAEVDSGAHVLRAVRIGFQPFERRIAVSHRGAFIEIEMSRLVQLDTMPIRAMRSGVFGKIIARSPYSGLRDAEVTVVGAHATARTDDGGNFNLPGVTPGAYVVNVRRKGFAGRLLSIVVPDEGAVELSLVLDATREADSGKHGDMLMAEFESRVQMRGTNSAIIPRQELAGRLGMSLGDALRYSPSFLLSGLVIDDATTCVFVNGRAAPARIVDEFAAAEVVAVEVYGLRGDYTTTLAGRWPKGLRCGRGELDAPQSSGRTGLQSAGVGPNRIPADNIVRSVIIWTVR